MKNIHLRNNHLKSFGEYLCHEEKSQATIEKYLRDIKKFMQYANDRALTKDLVIEYKKKLIDCGYAIRSINSMLASLNSLLRFLGREECKVKSIRQQRQIYCAEGKELTRAEYMRLLEVSKSSPKLSLLMKTICSTGIRVSELKYFTVEAVKKGEIIVHCKNKLRNILIPGKLKKRLIDYSKRHKICTGPIFITRNGKPMNRSNIWAQMKKLSHKANINPDKVFPHNLRKLFARSFYSLEKDIAKLADVLGHSSIDTTRIYIMTSGVEHRKELEKLGLVW